MNAADVLQAAMYPYGATPMASFSAHTLMDALLAHGEQGQGVTIEADGELHPKDPPMTTRLPDATLWKLAKHPTRMWGGDPLYRLVPVSAEAGDTDAG